MLLSSQARWSELEPLLHQALKVPGVKKNKIYNEFAIAEEVQSNYAAALDYYQQAIRFAFKDSEIATYQGSMERVRKKMELLN